MRARPRATPRPRSSGARRLRPTFRSANACSAASLLRAMNSSTSSAASHAPRRFISGPSAALRVCSSTMLAAAWSSRLSVVTSAYRYVLTMRIWDCRSFVSASTASSARTSRVGDGSRFGRADVELVELRDEPIDGREDAFEGAAEGPVVESGEDRREIPARGRLGSGHGETLDAPPAIRRGVASLRVRTRRVRRRHRRAPRRARTGRERPAA